MDLIETIKKFGVSETAAKVYLALLDEKKLSAGKIAKKARLYKANTYEALKKLEEVGLVSSIHENKTIYIPTNPEKLSIVLDEYKRKSEEKMEDLKKDLQKILPSLKNRYADVREKELFEIYKGRQAFKSAISEIIKEKPKSWRGFGNLQIVEYFPNEFVHWFKYIPMYLFATKEEKVLERLKEAQKTTKVEVSWIPDDVYMPVVWVVFGDNLLIVMYEPEVILIRMKSSEIIKTFDNQFKYLWKKYK